MNIFYLDNDPLKCAQMHNDKHCIKMILEYCQLLSTAHRVLDGHNVIMKSKTGRNVQRWVLNDTRNDILYSATNITTQALCGVASLYQTTNGCMNYWWSYVLNTHIDTEKYTSAKKLASLKH